MTAPLRILVMAEAPFGAGGSGAEAGLDGQVAGLRARGHRVVVICAKQVRADAGVEVRAVGWSALTPWRARAAALPDLARGVVDAIVLHHPLPGLVLLAAARRARVPVIALVHSPWRDEYLVRRPDASARRRALGALRHRIEHRVLTRVDRVYALSRFMADRVAAAHGLPAAAVAVNPGGVDRARFAPPADRAAARRRLGLPAEAPVLFCLRNLEPRMGVDVLLDAMPAVRARHPDVLLVVGGRGPLAAPLRARAAALGLEGAVRFTGFLPDAELPAWFGAADASVLPTQHMEGFGLVTVESLACGTPVVATPVGATPEILAPLDPALLADGAGAEALARAILALLARPDREALGARGREHTSRYAWAAYAERLEAMLA
ncbi:MAG TPA: glycosyltransferase family 4 protein [Terriglobales bacterium]|nr:glycosyltransferase family 4 protein [Terriglobales bacterium]